MMRGNKNLAVQRLDQRFLGLAVERRNLVGAEFRGAVVVGSEGCERGVEAQAEGEEEVEDVVEVWGEPGMEFVDCGVAAGAAEGFGDVTGEEGGDGADSELAGKV